MTIQLEELARSTIQKVVDSRYPDMDKKSYRLLEPLLTPRVLKKGEMLIRQGEISKDVVFVGKGMIRQFYYKNNKEITEHFSYEGCIMMNIESLFRSTPGHLTVEALEPSTVFLLPMNQFRELMREDEDINIFYQRVLEYSLIMSQIKSDSIRFESAKERYNRLFKSHPEVVKRAPLTHIASYLVMTPETLSRVRAGGLD